MIKYLMAAVRANWGLKLSYHLFYVTFWPPFDSKRTQGWASFEVLPRDPPELYLSHVCPTTSLEATNTDVLISILLHCLFTLRLLCFSYSKMEGAPGLQPRYAEFKAGSVQDGARRRGEEQPCGYPPSTIQPGNIPRHSSHSFSKT